MIAFICLFFPAVLTVWLYETVGKAELAPKKWLYRYCVSNLLINLVCFGVKNYILRNAFEPLYTQAVDMAPISAMHYLIIAVPAAVVLAFVQVLLTKHTKITIEAKNNG